MCCCISTTSILLFSDVPVCSVMSCGGVIIIFSVLNNFSTHFILASYYSRLLVKQGMSFFPPLSPMFCVLELWSPHGYRCYAFCAFSLESFEDSVPGLFLQAQQNYESVLKTGTK